MQGTRFGLVLGFFVAGFIAPFGASAAPTITAVIGDVTVSGTGLVVPNTTDQYWLEIPAGDYETTCCGTIHIEPFSTAGSQTYQKKARVETGKDGTTDVLALKNAKISVPSGGALPGSDFPVTFETTFVAPPTYTAPTDIWYKLSASGKLKRGPNITSPPATNDSIKVCGYIDEQANGNWKGIGTTGCNAAYGGTELSETVSGTDTGDFPPLSPSNTVSYPFRPASLRLLKGEFKFTFTDVVDTLFLPAGVVVQNTAPPGPGGCPECRQKCPVCGPCKKCPK